ncbi:hypothetical protein B4147_5195 [Bacillus wiedmannii]|uniref:Uncharacterized protein n=1 Tax=Bacillus wiedmannii TaxID=1890302 RepID=A0A0G8C915_9BACI|nr:hypothetical protein B4147_5195 [Bacillus wiedmannii]
MSMLISKVFFGLLVWINYIDRKYSVLLQSFLRDKKVRLSTAEKPKSEP